MHIFPNDYKTWEKGMVHTCPVCSTRYTRGGIYWFLSEMAWSAWGWAMGVALITLGFGIIIGAPVVAFFYLLRLPFPPGKIVERGSLK